MKKIILFSASIILLAAGCSNSQPAAAPLVKNPPQSETKQPAPDTNEAGVKSFTIVAKNFSFTPNEIKVKKGDKVKIVFQNNDGFHDWVIDEFSAKTPRVKSGDSATVEFTADKTGTFEYYCSVGEHRAMGMKGNLIVENPFEK